MPEERKKPGKPEFPVNEEVLAKIEQLAASGLYRMQIADALGWGSSTLYDKIKKYPEISVAIKRGAASAIAEVTNSLFVNATQNMNTTAQIFYLKCRAGWNDKAAEEVTEASSEIDKDADEIDVAAQYQKIMAEK